MITCKSPFRWIQKVTNDFGTDIACIRLGNVHVITVSCPEIACEFLIKQDVIFASRPTNWSSEYVSLGYLTTALAPYGEHWKKMKKVITNEMVSPLKHQWLHGKRVEEADNLVRYVYNKCKNDGFVDVRDAAQHYDDGHKRELKKAVNILRKYHDPIIEERIQQWINGTKTNKDDLLDILITLKDADNNELLTMEEIKAQIVEVMLATVDNPSNALEWGLAEMLNQPELLKKATEELDNVVGKGRLVQESDFPKLNYVKACAREAFRLHPIVDFNIVHVAMSDTNVANYFIPKGSHILIRRQGIGQNPRVWKDPLKFIPESHLKSDGSNLVLTEPSLNLITFSAGRRSCPGIMLGTSMTVMLFARLLHGFTWSVLPNESCIDLSESKGGTIKAKPLLAFAKPRLSPEVYAIY
ncbi:hypothetical protein TanjilG_19478 [Lupinus angustifolius]|uniref:Uncharacterized protein n=1 Tax=Lupinus angustifolius TaxID=3871 RepID=A0A1J7IMW2_LUPAN|nr:hypothetical protein TanjilG_19478 [Lupinus angustifolius]